MRKKSIIFLIAFVLIVVFAVVATAKTITVAVAPFTVKSESGLDYLSTGVIDLFSSRLSKGNDVRVIDKATTIAQIGQPEMITKDNAAKTANELGVDYILFGSIDESAKGIVIDSFVACTGQETILPFFEKTSQYESADRILYLVNRIAQRIKKDVFKQDIKDVVVETHVVDDRDIYAHPDVLLKDLKESK